MNRFLTGLALSLVTASAAPAYIGNPITAGPLAVRVGASDLIVIATVEDVEKEPSLPVHPFAPGGPRGLYVGTLAVREVIHGDKSLKSVKAAAPFYYVTIDYEKILAQRKEAPAKHAPAMKTFRKGREGLFFLRWSPAHKHYTLAHDPLFVDKDDPVYKEELERTRSYARLLADPTANLQARDEKDRATTAALLIYRYRWPRLWGNAETPIDAGESKLILGALAGAKWDLYPNDFRAIQFNQCFNLLGSPDQPGWIGARGLVFAEAQVEPAKQWLGKNQGTFRIRKFVWEAPTGKAIRALHEHTQTVRCVAFRRDGKRLVSAGDDETIRVWDMNAGKQVLVLKGHTAAVRGVVFSADGKQIVSGGLDRTLRVWDAETGKEIRTFRGPAEDIYHLALSPDGQRIVSHGTGFNPTVWDAESGEPTATLKGHDNVVLRAVYSPDGKRIASGSHDATVKVWDAPTGKATLTLRGHVGGVRSVAFSLDGKRIVSGGDDKELRVWDAETGKETLTLKGHGGWVMAVAFSPDGKQIASGSVDQTLKLWDAQSGREIATLKGHSGQVHAVAFSPDGKYLASCCGDPIVRIWKVEVGR